MNLRKGSGGRRPVRPAVFPALPSRSRRSFAALTATGALIGTPHHMSPEQCLSEPVDARSDVYSLGAAYFKLPAAGGADRGGRISEAERLDVLDSAEPDADSLDGRLHPEALRRDDPSPPPFVPPAPPRPNPVRSADASRPPSGGKPPTPKPVAPNPPAPGQEIFSSEDTVGSGSGLFDPVELQREAELLDSVSAFPPNRSPCSSGSRTSPGGRPISWTPRSRRPRACASSRPPNSATPWPRPSDAPREPQNAIQNSSVTGAPREMGCGRPTRSWISVSGARPKRS